MTKHPDPIQTIVVATRRTQMLVVSPFLRKEAMNITHHAPVKLLEKALTTFVGLLLVSLLIIFTIEPSIYTTAFWPSWVPAERYPWPVLLFLGTLIAFLGILMYGVLHHWRWLFWLILIAWTSSVIQIPVEGLQLLGVFPNPYPVWYSLFRGGVGFIELGFAFWMIQTYQHQGVWAMGRKKGGTSESSCTNGTGTD